MRSHKNFRIKGWFTIWIEILFLIVFMIISRSYKCFMVHKPFTRSENSPNRLNASVAFEVESQTTLSISIIFSQRWRDAANSLKRESRQRSYVDPTIVDNIQLFFLFCFWWSQVEGKILILLKYIRKNVKFRYFWKMLITL